MAELQDAVFAFLADPATHGGELVTRFDTHAASVFLAGARALKVKRAVRFPFLDYSTLERREQACRAELAVNQRLAGQIYSGLLAVTREPGGQLALAGNGTPVEWVVQMRRFDENDTLDRLAQRGKIDDALARHLGQAVAVAQDALSRSAPAHREQWQASPEAWIRALADYIDEHALAFAETPLLFSPENIHALAEASRVQHKRVYSLLLERGQRGLIRRIHGDLHLGNVVLLEGRPVLFDAIEFSPLIATGDLLYDLAFLLMDLGERGLGRAANIVFNRYLVETQRVEDLSALAALPLFLSMRAAIRAKVTAARLHRDIDNENAALISSAERYFEFAQRFIVPPEPRLLAVGGLSGTGKTVLAQALAPELGPAPGAVVLRSDIERKALMGRSEHERLPHEAYTPQITARVFVILADKARRALAAGHSVILDAVFAREQERRLMHESAAALGVPFEALFLESDLPNRLARLANRHDDASDADIEVARRQESYDLGELGWPRVNAAGSSTETLSRARAALRMRFDSIRKE